MVCNQATPAGTKRLACLLEVSIIYQPADSSSLSRHQPEKEKKKVYLPRFSGRCEVTIVLESDRPEYKAPFGH